MSSSFCIFYHENLNEFSLPSNKKKLEIYENEKDPEEAIKDNKKGKLNLCVKNENTSQKIWQHTIDYIWIDSKILIKNIW